MGVLLTDLAMSRSVLGLLEHLSVKFPDVFMFYVYFTMRICHAFRAINENAAYSTKITNQPQVLYKWDFHIYW